MASERKPYHGSCHCGLIKYIVYITLPPQFESPTVPPKTGSQRIYKCNCSTCQKTGFFHVRPADSPDSFMVLSPLEEEVAVGEGGVRLKLGTAEKGKEEGEEEEPYAGAKGLQMGARGLLDYLCFDKMIHWYFCSACGVRCFDFMGPSETATVTLNGRGVKVWRPKSDGWAENETGYLSINACTLDQGQEGLDLREWHEKRWISYLDCKNWVGLNRFAEPHPGGMY